MAAWAEEAVLASPAAGADSAAALPVDFEVEAAAAVDSVAAGAVVVEGNQELSQ